MVKKYVCKDCSKEFDQKSHYDKHLNKKIPCVAKDLPLIEVINKVVAKEISKTIKETDKQIVINKSNSTDNSSDNESENSKNVKKSKTKTTTKSKKEKEKEIEIDYSYLRLPNNQEFSIYASLPAFIPLFEWKILTLLSIPILLIWSNAAPYE